MKNFLRWQLISDVQGYNTDSPVACAEPYKYSYSLPIAGGDLMRFIVPASAISYDREKIYAIGLLSRCQNVEYTVGTLVPNELENQLYVTVLIPTALPEGRCYQLLIYEQAYPQASPWEEIDRDCELSQEGEFTGYQLITEQRESGPMQRVPIVISNHLHYSRYHKTTKILQYSDRGFDWGYDYKSNPLFFHQLRIHVTIHEPGRVISTREYRQTNGVYQRGKTWVDKKRTLHTAYYDEPAHDAMANALHHRKLYFDGESYFLRGDYEEVHTEAMTNKDRFHELYTASAELLLQGYNQFNNGCIPSEPIPPCPPVRIQKLSGELIALVNCGEIFEIPSGFSWSYEISGSQLQHPAWQPVQIVNGNNELITSVLPGYTLTVTSGFSFGYRILQQITALV